MISKKIKKFSALVIAQFMISVSQVGATHVGRTSAETGVDRVLHDAERLFSQLIPIFFAIALIVFIWGLVQFLLANGSEDKTEDGKRIMIWGIIALFVMASVWGLVNFLRGSFGFTGDKAGKIETPLVPVGGSADWGTI